MKKILTAIVFLAACTVLSAGEKISDSAERIIQEFFTLRMNLSLIDSTDSPSEVIAAIEAFGEDNAEEISAFNEQEKLILESFVLMEKYNYLYFYQSEKKGLKSLFAEHNKKLEKFFASNDESTFDKWMFCTRGDVISCSMAFSVSDVLKNGAAVKPLYEKALALDPEFPYALMNMGQWYYWAPGIAGGSKKKAVSWLEKAVASAKTPAEKYYACIFASQVYFELKNNGKCEEYLSQAEKCCPGSFYIAKIRNANKAGMSLFESNRKNSNVSD